MGIFDKLKSKKGEEGNKPPKPKKQEESVLNMVKEDQPQKPKKPVQLKSSTGQAYRILMHPRFSEKSTALAATGRYVFAVHPDANKPEIAKAVEKVYDVHVRKVNLMNVSGKHRRYGRAEGRTKSWKKAIVTLKAGEKIEELSGNI